jgi:DNA polymerase-1
MLAREGVDLRGLTWDTQEAMRLLNENEPSFALKRLVTKYLGIDSQTYGDLFGSVGFDEVSDLQIALAYAAKDGDVTRKLRDFQRDHLRRFPEMLAYYESVEVPLIKTIVHMESTGYDIDTDYAAEYGRKLKSEIDELHAQLIHVLGDINVDSPAQLKPALSNVVGEKLESTDAKKVLKPLAHKHPIIQTLLDYKAKVKLYSTYINVLPELIDKRTGKLHANFNGNGAKTGRMSSGGDGGNGGSVNLQNQPKDARKLFVAPPGYVIIGADWSQQEYRCLAYLTGEPLLVNAYREGKDVYSFMASRIFGVPYEECGDGTDYRKKAKVGLLATVYGTSKYTLALQLGVSVDEADKFLKDLFSSMPVVTKWIEGNKRFVRKNGFVWMDKKQRKRRLPEAKNPQAERWQRSRAERQATNAIVQGSSAIQTKVSMNAIYRWCMAKQAQGRDFKMWCVVHDESLILAPDDVTREEVQEYERLMLESYKFGDIPLKTDVEMMYRWGQSVTVDEWFSGIRPEK